MNDLRLVPVAAGLSDFEAKLLVAQLGADGILWQTRGIVDSIYPFGGIDVLVPTDQLDDARQVLAAAGGRSTVDGPSEDGPSEDGPSEDGAPEDGAPEDGAPEHVRPRPAPPDHLHDAPGGGPTWWIALAAVGAVLAVVVVSVFAMV